MTSVFMLMRKSFSGGRVTTKVVFLQNRHRHTAVKSEQ